MEGMIHGSTETWVSFIAALYRVLFTRAILAAGEERNGTEPSLVLGM